MMTLERTSINPELSNDPSRRRRGALTLRGALVALGLVVVVFSRGTGAAVSCGQYFTFPAPFAGHYSCQLGIGSTNGIPPNGAFVFLDDNNLLMGSNYAVFQVPVIRGAGNHIVGTGTPFQVGYANSAYGPFGGMDFGPGGVLFAADLDPNICCWPGVLLQYKPSTLANPPGTNHADRLISFFNASRLPLFWGLGFVPTGFAGAGSLKLFQPTSFYSGDWYSATVAPDGTGTYNLATLQRTVTLSHYPGRATISYVHAGNPGFTQDSVLLASDYGGIIAMPIDGNGDPDPNSYQTFMSTAGTTQILGGTFDPVTGDYVFNGYFSLSLITGFNPPTPPVPPPQMTSNVSGTLGTNGWYTSDVSVLWSIDFGGAQTTSSSGCDPVMVTADTTGTTFTCMATSEGGSVSSSVTVKRDATNPDTMLSSSVDGNNTAVPNGGATKSASMTFQFAASDNVDVAKVQCSVDLGAFLDCASPRALTGLSEGVHTFAVSAVDTAGNVDPTPATFMWTVDLTPPVITTPANVTAEATSPSGAVVTYSATANDAVSGAVSASCSPASESTFPLGDTAVMCTATDGAGNTATKSFSVTVQDTTPPSISGLAVSSAMLWPPNHRMVDVMVHYTVTDNGTVSTAISSVVTITSSEPDDGLGDGDTPNDIALVDAHHVRLRAERSGMGDGRAYTITITCTDAAQNSSSQTVIVTVPKSQGR